MIKLSIPKTIFIGIFIFISSSIYLYSKSHFNTKINFSCSAKGIVTVNNKTLSYVSSYIFKSNGNGATTLTGRITDKNGVADKIGIQIYFNYSLESGLLMLKTTNIVKLAENAASEEVIKDTFPSIYYRINSIHNIAIFKMGSGYRFDFNTYPVMYCY